MFIGRYYDTVYRGVFQSDARWKKFTNAVKSVMGKDIYEYCPDEPDDEDDDQSVSRKRKRE
jgi:hypothetical protein